MSGRRKGTNRGAEAHSHNSEGPENQLQVSNNSNTPDPTVVGNTEDNMDGH